MNISIIGGNARNKGALLMLNASIEIIKNLPINKIYIFTPFPEKDADFFNQFNNKDYGFEVLIVKWDQMNIICAFFAKLIGLKLTDINKALSDSEYTLDISGISFVSKRGVKYLIYNVLTIYLPTIHKTKLIKFPQSFGPIDQKYYRFLAKYFLDKCHKIFARGELSKLELEKIGILSTISSDLGFYYNQELNPSEYRNVVGINPSIVIEKYFSNKSIDYILFLENLITNLADRASKIIVFPQSYSYIQDDKVFNDVQIINKLKNKISLTNVEFLVEDYDIDSLFKIYKNIDICITSRFHGMIMSIVSNKIPIVVGWNHKYTEVLESMNLSRLNLDINNNLVNKIVENYIDISSNYKEYTNIVNKNRPEINNLKNIENYF